MFNKNLKAGFTLYELLIVLGIITIVAGIVLFNHRKFQTDTEVTNIAYRVALSAREAQVYSISVKPFLGSGGPDFEVPYGLHFEKESPFDYIFYADVDGNGLYTPAIPSGGMDCATGIDSECIRKISIGRGNYIKAICGILWDDDNSEGVQPCVDLEQDLGDYHYFDLKFIRPLPEALFSVYGLDKYDIGEEIEDVCTTITAGGSEIQCTGWAICLVSPEGKEKRVSVYQTGQIAVEDVTPGTSCATVTP